MSSHFNFAANSWDTDEKIQKNKDYSTKIRSIVCKDEFKCVLEVGCGTGLLGANFVNDHNLLLGIDTSEGMLKVFENKFKTLQNVSCKNFNFEDDVPLSFDQKFDLIISSMSFHHMNHPLNVLLKLKKLLVPNGVIAIIDLDEENGAFHPDSAKMGVQHFGFSKSKTQDWAQKLDAANYQRVIIDNIVKDSGSFPIFLATFHF